MYIKVPWSLASQQWERFGRLLNKSLCSHSFGFECRKRANLACLDNNTLLFAAGNLLALLDLESMQQSYRWTLGGGGVGAIAVRETSLPFAQSVGSCAVTLTGPLPLCQVHPSHAYFAVGEKGENPVIAIYTYPELVLHRVLRGNHFTNVYIHTHVYTFAQ